MIIVIDTIIPVVIVIVTTDIMQHVHYPLGGL